MTDTDVEFWYEHPYRRTTLRGRVVYDRRPHLWNWRGIVRILARTPLPFDLQGFKLAAALTNLVLAWLVLTGKLFYAMSYFGVELLDKIPTLPGPQRFAVKRVIIPGLKWLLQKMSELFPEDNIEPEPFEPERYGDLVMEPTTEEDEQYA